MAKRDFGVPVSTKRGSTDLAVIENTGSKISQLHERAKGLAAETVAEVSLRRQKRVDLIFCVDCSGSVEGTEKSVSKGYADLIKRENEKENNLFVTTVLFNNSVQKITNAVHASLVPGLNYKAGGGTALFDAICETIDSVDNNISTNTDAVFVIMTDGAVDGEHSKRYKLEDAKARISQQKKAGWKFILLGAEGIDIKNVAELLGIDENLSATYSVKATQYNFLALENVLSDVRSTGEVSSDWLMPIKERLMLGDGHDHS
ncbi:MAG: VWA domain-containing protein [Coriobacteriales bacterium]|jgi:uncharacterized protein YegL|nr:VWA domain-containing protein [Coriobacteriales bacterium]